MRCPNCNEEIPNDSKFCFACGEAVSTVKKKTSEISLVCRRCGGELSIQSSKNTVLFCPYCGAKELIPESDYVKVEKHRSDNRRRVEYRKTDAQKDVEINKVDKDYKLRRAELKAKKDRSDNVLTIFSLGLLGVMVVGMLLWVGIDTIETNRTERHNRELLANGEIIMSSFTYSEYEGMNYSEAVEKLNTDGFTNVTLLKEKTGMFSKNKENMVISVKINDEPIETQKAYKPNVVVKVTYYSND